MNISDWVAIVAIVVICFFGWWLRNFVQFHLTNGTPREHVWEIAWRGKDAGGSP